MAENTEISWADDTFNPWEGCQETGSIACVGCYARERNLRYAPKGSTVAPNWGPRAPRRRTSAANWKKPLKWNREQEAYEHNCRLVGETLAPRFVFCASLADVFDNQVPSEWRRDLFELIRATPYLTWLLLTKRPQNIVKLFRATGSDDAGLEGHGDRLAAFWPRNAAIGCTVVTQEEADRDITKLLAAKSTLNPAFAFLSMEPLAEAVVIAEYLRPKGFGAVADHSVRPLYERPALDWVITGGATDQGKHKAFPSDPAWFRSLRDECAAAGVPFHFKQWGEWIGAEVYSEERDGRAQGGLTRAEGGGAALGAPTEWWEGDCWGGRVSVRVGHGNDPCTLDGVKHLARPEVMS